jgi:hypothetical protein
MKHARLLMSNKTDEHGRDRTCNLLIRSQAPCHWATHPVVVASLSKTEYVLARTKLQLVRQHRRFSSRTEISGRCNKKSEERMRCDSKPCCNSVCCSVPNAPSPMVRNSRLTRFLLFLGQIIEKEIDQDSVDLGVWVLPQNFSANHLHRPDAAAT